VSYLDLAKLATSLESIRAAVANERQKHGKDQAREIVAKSVRNIRVSVDQQMGKVVVEFYHPNRIAHSQQ
jgi:hypothetical protein